MSKSDQSLPSGREKVFTEVIVENSRVNSMSEVLRGKGIQKGNQVSRFHFKGFP